MVKLVASTMNHQPLTYRPCYDIVTNVENVTFEKTAIKVLRFFYLRFRMQNLHGIERNSEDR